MTDSIIQHHSTFVLMCAGIAAFLYGMGLVSSNLKKLTANRTKDLLQNLSKRPLWGCAVGALLSALMQSAGAVNTMLVGLAQARVVSLKQVIGVVLGASVGSTLTVQLISLQVYHYGLGIFAISFAGMFFAKKMLLKSSCHAAMGVGLLFMGLEWISFSSMALKQSPLFLSALEQLSHMPWAAMLAMAAFSALAQSATAGLGLTISFATAGVINFEQALYWVYGANIGSTATALMAAIGGTAAARQVAWSNCAFKICCVGVFYFLTPYVAGFVPGSTPQRLVANAHTLFNLLGVCMALPISHWVVGWLERSIGPSAAERKFDVQFLNKPHFNSLPVRLTHARREALRTADVFLSVLDDAILLIQNENTELWSSVKKRVRHIDFLSLEVSRFLARVAHKAPPPLDTEVINVVAFVTDVKNAASVIDKQLRGQAKKKHKLKLNFHAQSFSEIRRLHKESLNLCTLSFSAFQNSLQSHATHEQAMQIMRLKRHIKKFEATFRVQHLKRVAEGKEHSSVSPMYFDIITSFRKISGLLSNHLKPLQTSPIFWDKAAAREQHPQKGAPAMAPSVPQNIGRSMQQSMALQVRPKPVPASAIDINQGQ